MSEYSMYTGTLAPVMTCKTWVCSKLVYFKDTSKFNFKQYCKAAFLSITTQECLTHTKFIIILYIILTVNFILTLCSTT